MKNIYITWHYTTHGIAYMKHVLSAFYTQKCDMTKKPLFAEKIEQYEMNEVFSSPQNKGFIFDRIYYLTAPQRSFDELSFRRRHYRRSILEDKNIKETAGEVWDDLLNRFKQDTTLDNDFMQAEFNYVQQKFPEKFHLYKQQLWQDIQHFSIKDQVFWFLNESNAARIYSQKFNEIKININDLRNAQEIAEKLRPELQKIFERHKDANFIINASLGSTETQVVWHIFSEFGWLPPRTTLIRTYDDKTDRLDKRFKRFKIQEIPSKLISTITNQVKIYDAPKSTNRKIAEAKMETYINSGFAILILGERGIGKSYLAQKYKQNKEMVSVNCATFTDNEQLAESQLFGHKKGAFTDAKEAKKGFFEQANLGILFLDEIHHLNKSIQAKLMKAIETDENNFFSIKPLGAEKDIKIQTTLIFASNRKISELRKLLLPDFYDRITQLVIELPPLREVGEDIFQNIKNIWVNNMKFEQFYNFEDTIANDNKLVEWLKTLDLQGNYRDLQKIAIYYKTFLDFPAETQKILKEKSAFSFAKNEFERYISSENRVLELDDLLKNQLKINEVLKILQKKLAEQAIKKHGSAQKAAAFYTANGDKITERTLYNWKNQCP